MLIYDRGFIDLLFIVGRLYFVPFILFYSCEPTFVGRCWPSVNYTVVMPKPRRMVMFNSSIANVHAVTQILSETDRRYTLFFFLSVYDD